VKARPALFRAKSVEIQQAACHSAKVVSFDNNIISVFSSSLAIASSFDLVNAVCTGLEVWLPGLPFPLLHACTILPSMLLVLLELESLGL
jgi:hypothetical protein